MGSVVGLRFERLTVISSFKTGDKWMCLCRCDCGTQKVYRKDHVAAGATRSCGCLRDEGAVARAKAGVLHKNMLGHARIPEYRAWHAMKERCLNPNDARYKNYGARGITVCERWMNYTNFIADMKFKPSTKHSIERMDNTLGYSPENCKWATRKEQANNRRGNVFIFHDGRTQTAQQWADETGILAGTIVDRIKEGFPIEQVFTKGKLRARHRICLRNE
ncbi:hypothetical protein [Sphingomonas sp.]|uniref:hypothetical protein n=1 Tax=Sphingomonas sp. TaxID=28214 RepID=UPI0035677A50